MLERKRMRECRSGRAIKGKGAIGIVGREKRVKEKLRKRYMRSGEDRKDIR